MPALGGESIVITKDGSTNWNPVWAPDGKHLYFASDRKGGMRFWRVEIGDDGVPTSEPEAADGPSPYDSFNRRLEKVLNES